ncbi:peptidase C14 [Penicillium herquei]|nr:peptidase C14 [Penicillium herquei]
MRVRPMLNLVRDSGDSPIGAVVGASVALLILLLTIGLNIVITKIHRRGNKPRSGHLKAISNPFDAKFEIIAVHGLGADPDYTWSHRDSKATHLKRAHLLRDLLSGDFPKARIWSYQYDSTWLSDAPVKTTEEIGRIPLIFIGHSLGGIIIKQALCGVDSQEILNETCGVIFLGTPHQGSNVSITGTILTSLTGIFGSDSTLLLSLRHHDKGLTDLAERFNAHRVKSPLGEMLPVISFYETKPTYLFRYISLGQVVEKDSAILHASPQESYPIDTDHSGLNKFAGKEDEFYQKLKTSIRRLRVPSILERADKGIREEYTRFGRLKIERLSGDPLPLDQCYVNLAIVEQTSKEKNRKTQTDRKPAHQSLFARQGVETPDETVQIQISEIFDPRKSNDHSESQVHPRRVLMRGRAGVGKTTLCKKIVNDFISPKQTPINMAWEQLFDRVLWIPLRALKSKDPRDLLDLILKEFFENNLEREESIQLAQEIERQVAGSGSSRTLFILDGLDEVIYDLGENINDHSLLSKLLNMPSVIIMSRPNARIPTQVQKFDLELETVGFYPDQVQTYLENYPGIDQRLSDVQAFLERNWLLQELVRIPIQLDAFCYTWEGASSTSLSTMTSIYQAIEQKLWRKDVVKLRSITDIEAQEARESYIRHQVLTEINFLEYLAFNGLYRNVIDFTPNYRDELAEHEQGKGRNPPSDKDLAKLSFIRTSDPSSRPEDRSYHFIHLSFQEYFAARYFVRRWKENKDLELLTGGENSQDDQEELSPRRPVEFLSQRKYSTEYDIFWRFVAGLMSKSSEEITTFFAQIDAQPRDLLGSVHQRFIMRCLGEIERKDQQPWREKLEYDLAEVLLAENGIAEMPYLARMMEFPAQSLIQALEKGSEEQRTLILSHLQWRLFIEEEIICLLIHWLEGPISKQTAIVVIFTIGIGQNFQPRELSLDAVPEIVERLGDEDSEIRMAALEALKGRQGLSIDFIIAIIQCLEDEDSDVRHAALLALQGRRDLSSHALFAVVGRFSDKTPSVRFEALKVLEDQHRLSPDILAVIIRQLGGKDLYARGTALSALRYLQELTLDTLPIIVGWLEEEDLNLRMTALTALEYRYNLGHDAITMVVRQIGDKDSKVRRMAIETLKRQRLNPDALTMIIEWLNDKDSAIRKASLSALQDQELTPDVLTAIIGQLSDGDSGVCVASLQALKGGNLSLGTLTLILGKLEHESSDVRQAAIQRLIQQDPSPDALTAIIGRLGDKNSSVRREALQALKGRHLSHEFIAAIIEQLGHENSSTRRAALSALQDRHNLSPDFVSMIVGRLEDDCPYVREAALQALKIHPLSPSALTLILGQFDDKLSDIRIAVLEALQGRQDLSPDLLAAIITRLRDKDSDVRLVALRMLEDRQDLTPNLITEIVARLEDRNSFVREAALEQLKGRYLSPDAFLMIIKQLEHENLDIRWLAICALQDRRNLSPHTITAIAGQLRGEDSDICRKALSALHNQDNLSSDVISAIIRLLGDEYPYIREAAIQELIFRQNLTPDALAAIIERLEDENSEVRRAAIEALQEQKDLSPRVLAVIIERLGDEDSDVRQAAIQTLQDRKDLPLKAIINSGQSLYDKFLKNSFSEDIHWLISDNSLKMTFDTQTLQFQDDSIESEDLLSEIHRWCSLSNFRRVIPSDTQAEGQELNFRWQMSDLFDT